MFCSPSCFLFFDCSSHHPSHRFPLATITFSRMMYPSEQLCDRLAFPGSPSHQFRVEKRVVVVVAMIFIWLRCHANSGPV